MPSSIESLMGVVPQDDPNQMAQLAAQLRGDQQIGNFLSTSPRANISKPANQRVADVNTAATNFGLQRSVQRKAGQAQENKQQDFALRAAAIQQRRDAASSKAGAKASGFRGPTARQQTDFEKQAGDLRGMAGVVEGYRPEFANPGGGTPLTGTVSNLLAANAPILATEGAEVRQEWWRSFKKFFELVPRHEMFGSALTKSEQAQWRATTINENMTDRQIQKALKIYDKLNKAMAAKAAKNATIKGWDGDWIHHNYGDISGAVPQARALQAAEPVDEQNYEAQGWELQEDANGNQAWVNPENPAEFKEI